MRFFHIADVHLDTTFLSRSESVRKRLREAVLKSFERAIGFAIQNRVEGLLVAGDLFDSRRLSYGTERFLVEQLVRLDAAGIQCFYTPGNHDPAGAKSRVERLNLPDTFELFDGAKPRVADVISDGEVVARVVGAGHESSTETRNLAKAFPNATGDVPTVGLLHALVTSASTADRHDRYAPCTLADLRSHGYDYWALGHVHERQPVDAEKSIWYSGNTQGRSPKETGSRGGLLVSLTEVGPRVEFVPLDSIEWVDVRVDGLEEVSDAARLERQVRLACDAAFEPRAGVEARVARFILEGPTPLAPQLLRAEYVADLAADLKSTLDLLDVEVVLRNIRPPVNLDDYRGGQHVLSEVLALLDEMDLDPGLLMELAPDPIANADGAGSDPESYMRELVEGLASEAATRLLVEDD